MISLLYFQTVNLDNLKMTQVLYIDIVIKEILDLNAFTDDPEDKTETPLVSKSTDGKLDN